MFGKVQESNWIISVENRWFDQVTFIVLIRLRGDRGWRRARRWASIALLKGTGKSSHIQTCKVNLSLGNTEYRTSLFRYWTHPFHNKPAVRMMPEESLLCPTPRHLSPFSNCWCLVKWPEFLASVPNIEMGQLNFIILLTLNVTLSKVLFSFSIVSQRCSGLCQGLFLRRFFFHWNALPPPSEKAQSTVFLSPVCHLEFLLWDFIMFYNSNFFSWALTPEFPSCVFAILITVWKFLTGSTASSSMSLSHLKTLNGPMRRWLGPQEGWFPYFPCPLSGHTKSMEAYFFTVFHLSNSLTWLKTDNSKAACFIKW